MPNTRVYMEVDYEMSIRIREAAMYEGRELPEMTALLLAQAFRARFCIEINPDGTPVVPAAIRKAEYERIHLAPLTESAMKSRFGHG
jgi:hypothetical protein